MNATSNSDYAIRLNDLLRRKEAAPFEEPGGPIGPRARVLAREVAEALGFCRLGGVKLEGELAELNEAVLLPRMGISAAFQLSVDLREAAETLGSIENRYNNAVSSLEIDELVCSPLDVRMRAHAAFVAIEESYADWLERGDGSTPEFSRVMDNLLNRIDLFEQRMKEHLGLLALAAGTNLLGNQRAMLSEEESGPLPWWLDGTLEELAKKECKEAFENLPTKEWWESIRGNEIPE